MFGINISLSSLGESSLMPSVLHLYHQCQSSNKLYMGSLKVVENNCWFRKICLLKVHVLPGQVTWLRAATGWQVHQVCEITAQSWLAAAVPISLILTWASIWHLHVLPCTMYNHCHIKSLCYSDCSFSAFLKSATSCHLSQFIHYSVLFPIFYE